MRAPRPPRDTALYVLQQEARQLALEKRLLSHDLDVAQLRQKAAEEKANEAVAQAHQRRITAEEQAQRVTPSTLHTHVSAIAY